MANGNNSFWTEENKAVVKDLYIDQNKSSAIVGAHLGVSRNAVIGIINRMGYRKEKPPPVVRPPKRVHTKARTAADRVQRRAEGPSPQVICGESVHEPLLASVIDLTSDKCAYPYGNTDFKFCGRKRTRGAFCAIHASLCYHESYK